MNKISLRGVAFFGGAFLTMLFLMRFDPDAFVRLDALATAMAKLLLDIAPATFFIVLTTFGGKIAIVLIAILAIVALRKTPYFIARLILGLCGTAVSVALVKAVIARVRPPSLPWLGELPSYSFPSGHSASAMMLYGFIAVVIFLQMKKSYTRVVLLSALFLLVAAIGVSRIVLAAHYGSDVLASLFLGGLWLSLVFLPPLTPSEKKALTIR